jgi:hypothetical protein
MRCNSSGDSSSSNKANKAVVVVNRAERKRGWLGRSSSSSRGVVAITSCDMSRE